MTTDISTMLTARAGHFLLESGHHGSTWLALDALFVNPHELQPHVAALARLLERYRIDAVCGPLVGGAFLAQAVATVLNVEFYFTEPALSREHDGLFGTDYKLPAALHHRAAGQRFAVVDDAISAGSSARATERALVSAGASVVVVGALLVLGRVGLEHFAGRSIPVESVARRDFEIWAPSACPMCAAGTPVERP